MGKVGIMAFVLASAPFLMGQTTTTKTIEANQFILRDNAGKPNMISSNALL
jgi:hypothetical protein